MNSPLLPQNLLQLLVRWSIVITLWALLISMASGQSGVNNFRDLLHNSELLSARNAALEYEVDQLEAQVRQLKTSPSTRKRFLKDEVGLVEPNEAVFHFRSNLQKVVVER
jgi:cell division protein FtsB